MSPTLGFIVILLICDLFSAPQGSPIDVCLGGAKFCHRALQRLAHTKKLRWIWPWKWPRPPPIKPPPNKPPPNKPPPNKPPKPKPDMPDIADVPPPSYEEY
ncbi:unnamed protein product, partial [Iphiclides podalirius]